MQLDRNDDSIHLPFWRRTEPSSKALLTSSQLKVQIEELLEKDNNHFQQHGSSRVQIRTIREESLVAAQRVQARGVLCRLLAGNEEQLRHDFSRGGADKGGQDGDVQVQQDS